MDGEVKMEGIFGRTALLLGFEAMERLRKSHVAVFGVGGVGGYIVEALARSGIGEITVVDNDTVSPSNINRQIIATSSSIGMKKTECARERILSINSECIVHTYDTFFLPGKEEDFPFSSFSYIADAIDTVSGKLALAETAYRMGIPLISSMGAGNKLDPTQFRISDIFSTDTDPLSRVMRRELKKRGIKKLKVVWSPEKPITPIKTMEEDNSKRRSTPGSVAFVPSVSGLIMAGEIIRTLAQGEA